MSLMVLLFAGVVVLVNTVFLGRYYLFNTREMLREQAQAVDAAMPDVLYMNSRDFEYIERNNSVSLVIYNDDHEVLYATLLKYLSTTEDNWRQHFEEKLDSVLNYDIISTTDDSDTSRYEIQRDKELGTRYVAYRTQLSNGLWLMIRTDLRTADTSAQIANQFMIPLCAILIMVSLVACFLFVRHFTRPIVKMNEITRNMSRFDFSRKVEVQTHDEIGELAQSINILSDNTNRLLTDLQEKNKRLEKEIERERGMEKMRKEFVSNVSHELKTPIAIIQGYAEGLRLNVAADEERRKLYCDIIESESYKMDRLVRQLLELSQLESGQTTLNITQFDLTTMLGSVVERLKSITEDGVTIELVCEGEKPVQADEMRMGQVVTNYVNNAVTHTKGDKLVRVSVAEQPETYRVTVFNTGDHIPEEIMDRLWTSFYRADKARSRENGNYGLGLSIVSGIMKTHGCAYGVRNVEGGVEFWFEIKKATPEPQPAGEEETPAQENQAAKPEQKSKGAKSKQAPPAPDAGKQKK